MKIMVVEDDEVMRRALEIFLRKAGHIIVGANDGMKALEIFEQDKNFDLIITDIMMPNISGLTLLSTIKELKQEHIPVILISSLDTAKAISTTLELEADEVLIKPIDFAELLDKINRFKKEEINFS